MIKTRISKQRIGKSSVLTHLTPAFFLKYKYKMSSGTNAHPSRAGFNQSGGAYFMVIAPAGLTSDTTGVAAVTPSGTYNPTGNTSHMYRLATAGSNSGGAWTGPTFVVANARDAFGIDAASLTAGNASAVAYAAVGQGKLLKDMGKTVVSAGRTFRKFAAVGTGNALKFASSFGVAGGPGASPNSGYASFYLEVGREGNPGAPDPSAPAPIARYF